MSQTSGRVKLELLKNLITFYSFVVNHNGKDDWEVRLIDQIDTVEELRKG